MYDIDLVDVSLCVTPTCSACALLCARRGPKEPRDGRRQSLGPKATNVK